MGPTFKYSNIVSNAPIPHTIFISLCSLCLGRNFGKVSGMRTLLPAGRASHIARLDVTGFASLRFCVILALRNSRLYLKRCGLLTQNDMTAQMAILAVCLSTCKARQNCSRLSPRLSPFTPGKLFSLSSQVIPSLLLRSPSEVT